MAQAALKAVIQNLKGFGIFRLIAVSQAFHLLLRCFFIAGLPDQLFNLPRRHTLNVGLLDHLDESGFTPLSFRDEEWDVATVSYLRY